MWWVTTGRQRVLTAQGGGGGQEPADGAGQHCTQVEELFCGEMRWRPCRRWSAPC